MKGPFTSFITKDVVAMLTKLKTCYRLGLANIARVAIYRFGLRTGLHPATRMTSAIGGDEFFREPELPESELPALQTWNGRAQYFGWYEPRLDNKSPDWHVNPFNELKVETPDLPWWELSDFALRAGDIKTIWEASRFDWVLAHAQRIRAGDGNGLFRLTDWLQDWCLANPCYKGPNWKCGQEASIRVMHLAVAARLLGQEAQPARDLMRLIEAHMMRIDSTLSYGVAQNNNHGSSEAAALFIGGSWCQAQSLSQGARWARKGRRWLENRVKHLIEPDGSFSQYSVNYHRVLLDTLSMAELWRRWHGLAEFSLSFYERARAATYWLYTLVEPESGDAPNLGANDGARLLPLTNTDIRDFRPSVQLAMALFDERRAYEGEGAFDLPLKWLGVAPPETTAEKPESRQFQYGGYTVLRRGTWMVVFKYPRYRFRPKHCDALHLDLWSGTQNLLRDGGTFSYNSGEEWLTYFTGPAAHNTVQFDQRDQMPRIGRFLRGAWLRATDVEPINRVRDTVNTAAAYGDSRGAFHHRRVSLSPEALLVEDQVSGFTERAVLRWRLLPDDWQLEGTTVKSESYILRVTADVPIVRCELVEGWESRYYMRKTPLPVLEVEIQMPGSFHTELTIRGEAPHTQTGCV